MTMIENGRKLSGIQIIKARAETQGSGWVFDQETLEHARVTIEKNLDNGHKEREAIEMFEHLDLKLQEEVRTGDKSVYVDFNGNMIINKLSPSEK